MNREFKVLIDTFGKSYGTCSLDKPKKNCVTFVKNKNYIEQLIELKNYDNIIILLPYDVEINFSAAPNILYKVNNVDLVFTLYNNLVNEKFDPSQFDRIHETAIIHPSAVVGIDGVKVAIEGERKILFKHIGNVVVEKDVNIAANSVIHRARLDSTIIKRGTIIGSLTNIGHNVIIGRNCVITTNISIGGNARVGNNCWIGMGATIKNGVKICDNVVIGMAAVVVDDITKPGFYVGNPARFFKEYNSFGRGF